MKTTLHLIASLLTVCLLLATLCGCHTDLSSESGFQALFKLNTEEESVPPPREPEQLTELSLPYDPTDTANLSKMLDPYSSQTFANRYICQLIYDPLFRINEEMKAEPCIASSVKYSSVVVSEYETSYFCVMTLTEGLFFSDGSEITVSDVLYSLSLAIKNDSIYRDALANVISYNKSGDNQITFKLYQPDNLFASLLDIPIVKRNTDAENEFFIGSGRYRPLLVSGSIHLIKNENYYDVNNSMISLINLIEVEDGNMLMYNLKTGMIDFAFFDFDSDTPYNAASGTQSVQLNNMLFLGFNGNTQPVSYTAVRKAIALTLNRAPYLASYSGMATAAYTPQNPLFGPLKRYTPAEPDAEAAASLLLEAGYDTRDPSGVLLRKNRRLSLNLLVNKEDARRIAVAEQIKEQLTPLGFEIVIESLSFSDYTSRLASGDFDLYLGEVKLKYNMDISALLAGGSIAYNTPTSPELQETYTAWRTGGSLSAFNKEFENTLPFLPLLFRCGQVSFTRDLSYNIVSIEKDIFYNIADWE
ncbi:MAG: hypothetical protein E7487_05455 [Ruminococcaceae bacterium]|nr:hypothetical protein [Oscillospiraceae bacterium]